MKKILLSFLAAILLLTSAFGALADFANPSITDEAELLSESEFDKLSKKADAIRSKYNFDVAIYTEEYMSGDDAESRADDIFDYGGYGCGAEKDGIILYISEMPRAYHFSTHGKGIKYFNKNGLAYMEKQVLPFLKEDNFDAAAEAFFEQSEKLLGMASSGNIFNEKQYTLGYLLCVIGGALLIPLLLAYYMTKKQLEKMKTAVKQDYASDYMKPGSMNMHDSRDIFLYSTVTKTEKPKNNSGTHTSSSGETHGGRGGSY